MMLDLGRKRPGSILATSISLVAVFLTLVVGSMVYVQNTMSQARTERLRSSAEEAARSGLELVMGWAEANIDQETRLPKAWDSMTDGQVIDPIGQILENAGAAASTMTNANTVPGNVLGTNHNEYVVGKQGAYVTTFKARIQQFRISDDQPRQYRVGVVGRVRKIQPGSRAAFNNIDQNERESIVAERLVVATVGKEVTSRYAALIDIDGVKNWVPGEVVTGPVHINRGYTDDPLFAGLPGLIDGTAVAGYPGVTKRDLRSTMMLYIEGQTGNVGFKAPSAPPADNVQKYPIFESQVTLTEIPGGDAAAGRLAADPAENAEPIAIKINGFNYHRTNGSAQPLLNAFHDKIFASGENSTATRYGDNAGTFYRGPLIIKQPIELPRSIRNSLGAAIGLPGELLLANRYAGIADGVYVPTPRFWAIDPGAGLTAAALPPNDAYQFNQAPAGGIYIRGEVEAMRFGKGVQVGVDDHLSYYIFQVSKGIASGPGQRRCYVVVADRTAKKLALAALNRSAVQVIHGDVTNANGLTTLNDVLTLANIPANSAAWNPVLSDPVDQFAIEAASPARKRAFFAAPQFSEFPFNGVIYVDCSQADPARPSTDAATRTMATTGNILALGNLGAKASPSFGTTLTTGKNAFAIDRVIGETVATYKGTDPTGPASKLTIMARGNIFIQNHLLVDGVYKRYLVEAGQAGQVSVNTGVGAARNALTKIKLEHSRDVLGLVADKQIVVGAAAPRSADAPTQTDKRKAGVIVMASIAGLGDPAFRPWGPNLDPNYMTAPLTYVGSFSTEGLMQAYNQREEFYITRTNAPASAPTTAPTAGQLQSSEPSAVLGYPGNPIYLREGYGTISTAAGNPNTLTRGRMIVFGSITQKKRGIVGQGNQSYDKDFVYDKRLLTISPPIFPSSVNVLVRTQSPFSPDDGDPSRRLPYAKAGTIRQTPGDLDFMGATPAGATPAP